MTGVGGPQERDEVSFGPQSGVNSRQLGAQDPQHLDADPGAAIPYLRSNPPGSASRDPVDTWFEEEPAADSTTSRPNEARRYSGAHLVVARHSTPIVLGLWTLAVTALVAAAIGWGTREPMTTPAAGRAAGESHGLTANQAACFAFGRVEDRVEAVLGSVSPDGGGVQRPTVAAEITSLDTLGQEYPSADYRLIVAFADVADASVRIQNERDPARARPLLAARVNSLATANNACRDLASYDLTRTGPVQVGE